MTRCLSIDLETYSEVDIGKCGVDRYAEDSSFENLLIGYAFDDDPVEVIDLTDPVTDIAQIKRQFTEWLLDATIKKTAWNAAFEMTCFTHWLGQEMIPEQWSDTMITAATCGLPMSLGGAGKALDLPQDAQKDRRGKELIRYFCVPCKPTQSNGGRTRNMPSDAPDKWATFIEYNRQDVVTERAIRKRLEAYEPDADEHEAWCLDYRINRRGVLCDRPLAEASISIAEEHSKLLTAKMKALTGLANPNSMVQLKSWFGVTGSLDKEVVKEMLSTETGDRLEVLKIRKELGKSSVAKYDAMERYMCRDNRCRGLFQFYGAGRTGRFAGRGVQLQNLTKNHFEDLDAARNAVLTSDRDVVEALYGDVTDTLSQLVRTAFIAKPGHVFAVADFSAIEARVSAWLTGEDWVVDSFKQGKDIYCETASQMFGVPVGKHGPNAELRQKGKIAVLALGYGGTEGAMLKMGALKMGLKEDELPQIVKSWREANPHIVNYWYKLEEVVRDSVVNREQGFLPYGLEVFRTGRLLHIRLPSGRCIRYYKPRMTTNRFGKESVGYSSFDKRTEQLTETWGGKLFENVVQAVARDCLIVSMLRVAEKYPDIVMHIHDEMVVEVPENEAEEALQYMYACMSEPIEWAPGLPLKGAGYITPYYMKD